MFVGARFSLLVALCLLVAGGLAARAQAQDRFPATVTAVVDGDTVDAQVAGGPALEVQLIGIDAPEPDDCGGDEATGHLRQLALGRNVTLVSDPTLEQFESPGNRPLFYVDRDDGLDVGLEMLRAGWAEIWELSDFQRSSAYMATEQTAERFQQGAWIRCRGDFHFNRGEELRQRRRSALEFVRRYYRRISSNRFGAAWGMLSRRVRRDFGPFRSWKAGYRRSLRTTVPFARARLSGRRAVVSVRLRVRDRDACSDRVVQQRFRGKWTLAPRRDSWVGIKVRMRKTGGGRPRLSSADCAPNPPPPPPPPPPPSNCQGYSPCIPPGPDVDCAGGSGNGPRYRDGPIYVSGDDPYDLDRDGDGVACEE
jgi:endonuclease YncB( thermonuclease family)